MQWYDCLRIEVERMKETAIATRFNNQPSAETASTPPASSDPIPSASKDSETADSEPETTDSEPETTDSERPAKRWQILRSWTVSHPNDPE
jgi:hypothetical protein